eukprot:NODE_41_length_29768_cov_0.533924.p14 type:complete len:179 gc:universal NODE_41_length_29768_cov_0.533924:24857-24321(-)
MLLLWSFISAIPVPWNLPTVTSAIGFKSVHPLYGNYNFQKPLFDVESKRVPSAEDPEVPINPNLHKILSTSVQLQEDNSSPFLTEASVNREFKEVFGGNSKKSVQPVGMATEQQEIHDAIPDIRMTEEQKEKYMSLLDYAFEPRAEKDGRITYVARTPMDYTSIKDMLPGFKKPNGNQ